MFAAAHGGEAEGQYEVCQDDGFIYKRRRRRGRDAPPYPPPPPLPSTAAVVTSAAADTDESDLRRRRRAKRKELLLTIRDRYRAELDLWDRLSSSALSPPPPPSPPIDFSSLTVHGGESGGAREHLLTELISQADAQELLLKKLSGVCDYVESMCDTEEERRAQALLELPVWGSPKSLITSLSN